MYEINKHKYTHKTKRNIKNGICLNDIQAQVIS